jgi:hypothetical protein
MARKQGHGKQAASRPSDGRGMKGSRQTKWPMPSSRPARGVPDPAPPAKPAKGKAKQDEADG